MGAPFILVNEYAIQPDKTGEFLEAFRAIVDIAEAHEPELLYFAEHLSEDGTQGSTVQVHASAQNMERHMQLVGEHIARLVHYLEFEAIRIYGTPTDSVLEQLRQIAGDRVTVRPLSVGFDRFLDRETQVSPR